MKNIALMLVVIMLGVAAQAQIYTESILYNFGGSIISGSHPNGLVMDSGGNLYGTTVSWGNTSTACPDGCGVVFKITPGGAETILHAFTGGTDGASPVASLTRDKSGNLYGTTVAGGLGTGIVFKITSAGKYSILYKFGRIAGDGQSPEGPLTLDSAGNLYGTTYGGGDTTCNCGTIFKVTPRGTETVLYKFLGGTSDGMYPNANVLRDGKGNLYGTTTIDGSGTFSTVWELSSNNIESILYDSSAINPYVPFGYIARNAAGNFYWTWIDNSDIPDCCGGLVELSHGAASLYAFYSGYDGNCPPPLMIGPLAFFQSNLYGVMWQGGAYSTCVMGGQSLPGGGDVYEFNPATGQQTTLYNFPDPSSGSTTDGWNPAGGVIADSTGNLYGTTSVGGSYGQGVVFKLTKE